MATTFGKIDEFNGENEEWRHYIERMNHFFEANDIEDEAKQRSIFLVSVGAKTYKLIRSLVAPEDPKSHTFEELTQLMQDHYQPKPSVIVERFKFNTRCQQSGETIPMYLAELKRLSENCEFGTNLNELLRDRVVCGTSDTKIQRRLLAESNLTLKRALDLAIAIETSEKDALNLQQSNPQGENAIHKFDGTNRDPKGQDHVYKCSRCDGRHSAAECRFKEVKCHACGKIGHISRACRSKGKGKQEGTNQGKQWSKGRPTHHLSEHSQDCEDSPNEENAPSTYSMFKFGQTDTTPYKVNMSINGTPIDMEVDTGASLSVIGEATYMDLQSEGKAPPLEDTDVVLRTYTGEEVKPKGSLEVKVSYEGKEFKLPLLVVQGQGPALLGRNWLREIRLNWPMIKQLAPINQQLDKVVQSYSHLFEEGLGTLKGVTAKIYVDPSATPVFHKARPVPYALREKIEQDLERLEKAGTIEPVQFSEWATPIVPVMKQDGTVRVCGDYKLTVNKVSKLDAYPIPKLDDLYTKLAGGKTFTELDLSHAYEQMLVDEGSKEFLTINTHKGLYRYNRLPYGAASAPGIFQRMMEQLLKGLPHAGVLLDNVPITGITEEEHLANLEEVLKRLSDAGLRLKVSKCQFMKPSLDCLGHHIDEDGFHPVAAKVEAIKDAPAPTNVTELKSFLGMINFYGKFLPNLSSTLEPLHELLRKGTRWTWSSRQQKAYDAAKALLLSSQVLVHYNPEKTLILSCDASPYGVGAVLAHKMDDGSERPIAYASRTLSKAERGYAQLDKEALAILFGVKKFHQFVYGRHFMVYTDHKPLLGLLNPDKAIPYMASSRMQRWALTLLAYEYELIYRPGNQNSNADSLSRLPLPDVPESIPVPGDIINLMEHINASQVDAAKLKLWTDRDPVLSRVKQSVLNGWPTTVQGTDLQPYFSRKDELSVHAGCLMWGARVIVPPQGRDEVMNILHDNHPGMVRMKSIARSHVWWPKMDQALEERVKSCKICQEQRKMPATAALHPWEWPSRPWTRLHIDYAGPFMGKMFLIIIDAHSKWLDVHCVNTATSEITIAKLRSTFATHGLPEIIVSDNGTVFTSQEFKIFTQRNGIRHITSAPYHPSSNGFAERTVQTFKQGMKKQVEGTVETKLARFLLSYRTTPQTTTGETPAQLRWGRSLRTHMDLLKPNVAAKVETAQIQQKRRHDKHSRPRSFSVGDTVYARNYNGNGKWIPGAIVEETGPVSVKVELENGIIIRRHHDQLLARRTVGPERATPLLDQPELLDEEPHDIPLQQVMAPQVEDLEQNNELVRNYPVRNRGPPDRYG